MKAITTKEYGTEDVLNIKEVEIPTISENEILVAVKYASINPLDWRIRTGELKIMTGKTPPKILGSDFSGVVSKVGKNIKAYQKGDEVFGMIDIVKQKEGAYAEFIKVSENDIYKKPNNISLEEASSLPMVSLTAYTALVNIANIKQGSNVLINGCTGGVGSHAVQVAKSSGCKVTGVCSTNNVDFAINLGASKIIDYKKEDVLTLDNKYDVIFDTVGNLEFSKSKNILNSSGIYVTTAATPSAMFLSPIANIFRSKKLKVVIVKPNAQLLAIIKKMVEQNELKPNISKTFDFEQIKNAHKMSQKGGFIGKLVLKINS